MATRPSLKNFPRHDEFLRKIVKICLDTFQLQNNSLFEIDTAYPYTQI
jgi:hypothetical protein